MPTCPERLEGGSACLKSCVDPRRFRTCPYERELKHPPPCCSLYEKLLEDVQVFTRPSLVAQNSGIEIKRLGLAGLQLLSVGVPGVD
jgi:hypothetical protein